MKLKILTTCDNPNHQGYLKLKRSLDHFGYDHEVIVHPFSFGHQLPVIRDWCNQYGEHFTHLLYTDAFDTIAFGGPDEVLEKFKTFGDIKMLISGEKNCYPLADRAVDYPFTETPWKYVNGGGWLVEIEYFKQLCQKENLTLDSHDQVWLMESFLKNQDDIKIDYQCKILQTIAFSYPEEWVEVATGELSIESQRRFMNKGTKTLPVFFHGNGHTDMSWLYDTAK